MSSPTLFQNIAGDPLKFWRGQELNLRKVRDFANLSNKDISRMAGVAPTSVRFDDKVPVEVLERMENIAGGRAMAVFPKTFPNSTSTVRIRGAPDQARLTVLDSQTCKESERAW